MKDNTNVKLVHTDVPYFNVAECIKNISCSLIDTSVSLDRNLSLEEVLRLTTLEILGYLKWVKDDEEHYKQVLPLLLREAETITRGHNDNH